MAALAGILNQGSSTQGTPAAQALAGLGATPAATANATNGTSGTTSNAATISANDFLTLLVTEMQNQDPTADVDPNEYINQLVNVNSLEQLISINQVLTNSLGTSSTTAGAAPASAQSATTASGAEGVSAVPAASGGSSTLPGAISTAAGELAPGNLGVPSANSAAQRVAESLSGKL